MARQRSPAHQTPWYDEPATLERVTNVWRRYLRREHYDDIARALSVSVSTVRNDVERARELVRGAATGAVTELLAEAIEERARISEALWVEIDALEAGRGAVVSETSGGVNTTISTESPATHARAKADLYRALMQNEREREELLTLRKQRDEVHQDNRVLVVIDREGVARRMLTGGKMGEVVEGTAREVDGKGSRG